MHNNKVHSDSTHDDVVRSRFIANKVIDGEEKFSYISLTSESNVIKVRISYDTMRYFFTIDK